MGVTEKCALTLALLLAISAPAAAQTDITHRNALRGGVTPGDTAGYPITLSRGGSYILKSNLEVPANVNGIEIRDFDVTVDFNGFRMHGRNAARFGVHGTLNTSKIRNGVIAGFASTAIFAGGQAFWKVEDMTILVNGGSGVFLGESALVLNNIVSLNRGHGIALLSGTVLGNTITSNALTGIIKLDDFRPFVLGYGNNTAYGNNDGSGPQVIGGRPLHANACAPAC